MSSEKGLVITPTEQLPFKCACYSRVLFFFFFFFFFFFLGWPREISSFPLFLRGGKFYSFFSSHLVAEFSLSRCRKRKKEWKRCASARRGRRHLCSCPSFLRLPRKREWKRVKEREIWVFFFSPLVVGSFNGNFCSFFFGQTRHEKAAWLTFFIRILYNSWTEETNRDGLNGAQPDLSRPSV